jgi:hypothetical protein
LGYAFANNSAPIIIGRTNPVGICGTSDFFYFPGDIDDIRIYNRALTEAEIQALYQEGGWK